MTSPANPSEVNDARWMIRRLGKLATLYGFSEAEIRQCIQNWLRHHRGRRELLVNEVLTMSLLLVRVAADMAPITLGPPPGANRTPEWLADHAALVEMLATPPGSEAIGESIRARLRSCQDIDETRLSMATIALYLAAHATRAAAHFMQRADGVGTHELSDVAAEFGVKLDDGLSSFGDGIDHAGETA